MHFPKNIRIFVAGHRGLVGSAITQALKTQGYNELLLKTREELDLRNQVQVDSFFEKEKPELVFLAAAKVGGILANKQAPAEFLADNLRIELNVIQAAQKYQVKKLLFLGSSCIYPRLAEQPIKESSLLTGALEPTNEGYAIAKIAGLKLCEYLMTQYGVQFISAMPCNLYGPNDNFHPTQSHVIPGLMRRFHEAKIKHLPQVTVWGTGKPLREFLHVWDLAQALLYLMDHYQEPQTINVGSGEEVSLKELALLISESVGYPGDICFDPSKPDGTPRKIMDSSRIHALGWKSKIALKEGLKETYDWALTQKII